MWTDPLYFQHAVVQESCELVTVIICDEIRADEADIVSEELKRSCTVYPEKCDQAVVWISHLQNSTYGGG